jgi:small ligand-binding sensory domain FIST
VQTVSAFRYGHAADQNWQEAARACLTQLEPVPQTGNLGFLYVTDGLASQLGDVMNYLREQSGVAHWVGAVGMGICATGKEYYDEPALAVLVGEFTADSFRLFSSVSSDLEAFREANSDWIRQHQPYFAIVHGDPRNTATEELVASLASELDSGFLVGGLTSSRGPHYQVADGLEQGGMSGVLFSPDVLVTTRLTQGCSPIGPRREITQCEGNILVELDGRKALEVFKEDIGDVLARDLNRTAGYIFAGLPVSGSDTGDYRVRNLMGIDANNGLIAIGERVQRGESVMFCRRDAQTAREDLVRMLHEIRRGLSGPPRGGVYYSCVGRGISLFGPDSAELKLVRDLLGEFPLVGFYANGEISHQRLYGYTGVLTLFL